MLNLALAVVLAGFTLLMVNALTQSKKHNYSSGSRRRLLKELEKHE